MTFKIEILLQINHELTLLVSYFPTFVYRFRDISEYITILNFASQILGKDKSDYCLQGANNIFIFSPILLYFHEEHSILSSTVYRNLRKQDNQLEKRYSST